MTTHRAKLEFSFLLLVVFATAHVFGTGCQHSCQCGFDWSDGDLSDEDVTLRYEVMAGLSGGFAPLVIGGMAAILYKVCSKGATSAAGSLASAAMAPSGMSSPYLGGGPWRNSGRIDEKGGPPAYDRTRGSTPMSLYGESEDDFLSKGSGQSPGRIGTANSRYTNIHRNVKSDAINQWFKNVTNKKY